MPVVTRKSLAEDKHPEEKDPEDPHGMPVPGGAVDDHLSQLDAAQEDERQHRAGQSGHANQKMETVGSGDQVEKVAARIGGEEDALIHQLLPGDPLAAEKQATE